MRVAQCVPYSKIRPPDVPRGCALSWQVALLAHLDPDRARSLYARYAKLFWRDELLLSGFAEWPAGSRAMPTQTPARSSSALGAGASVLGLAATSAAGDTTRHARLTSQIAAMRAMIDPSSPYVTGFLFGDAVLFYTLTYRRFE